MMSIATLSSLADRLPNTDAMPVLFIGHGSPMNAITHNPFRAAWRAIGEKLPHPKAILCVSAHWETRGTSVAVTPKPKMIYDFYGFPDALYRENYPAPGAPDYAHLAMETAASTHIHADDDWGLDHGAWAVLEHMFPDAKTPVFQMSLDMTKPPAAHLALAQELVSLRSKGVMVIASGNIVHNLRLMRAQSHAFDWAQEFDAYTKTALEHNDNTALVDFTKAGRSAMLAVPTLDHYLPLLYAQGFRQENDRLTFFNEDFDLGSMSMRCVMLTH
jgi:4,5-DOPA dioxygenase extradiol